MFCALKVNKSYCLMRALGRRSLSARNRPYIMGIETSCDDTGCAIIDAHGRILGEALNSQNKLHLRYGGVNPVVAQELHRENIEPVVKEALNNAKLSFEDVDAVAVTVKPGLLISLQIGVKYANYLCKTYKKPLIPIHHMEAHALVCRMFNKIDFPFLVLLISGGHCLLALVQDIDKFLLLGQSLDIAPGDALDKVARRLKLKNIKAFSDLSGGQAIENSATLATNPSQFPFPVPLVRTKDCNFSFSGLQESAFYKLKSKETEHNVIGSGVIPEVNDLCSAFQSSIAAHLLHRTTRAVEFCINKDLLPKTGTLVVSGGVACNNYIYNYLQQLNITRGIKVIRPPSRFCTDNGVMIAWNGLEKFNTGLSYPYFFNPKDISPKASLGCNITQEVANANITVTQRSIKV